MEARLAAAVAEWTPGSSAWLLVWLLKGSLLLALLFLAVALLRRFSSSTRHLVWTAGLAVTLALPLVSTGVLPWRLELPLAPAFASSFSRPLGDVDPSSSGVAGGSGATALQSRALGAADLSVPSASSTVQPSNEAGTSGPSSSTTPTDNDRRTRAVVWWAGIGMLRLAVLIWAAGAAVLLVRLGRSAFHARRLVRNGVPLTDPAWTTPLIEAADRLDLPDLPKLLVNADAAVPLTCGIVRPSIVVPPASEAWTEERRRAVLCHELGHIRRRDLVSHLLGRLTCALYWFQPLAWSAARRMRAESERACDDLVLLSGTRASAYADHLLEIAAAGRGGAAPAVALPMAQPREFEARLLSILEPDKRREPLSRLQAVILAGLVLILVQPLVALTPVRTPPSRLAILDTAQSVEREAEPGSDVSNPGSAVSDQFRTPPAHPDRSTTRPLSSDSLPPFAVSTQAHEENEDEDWEPPVLPADEDSIAAAADTGRRGTRRSFERDIERGAEAFAESVTEATAFTFGSFFQSLTGQASQGDPRVRAALIEALRDPAPDVRRTAAWSLSTHDDSLVVRALAQALRSDEDARVREMSAWALAQLNAPASDDVAAEALVHAVASDASVDVRAAAAWALSSARRTSAVAALEQAVRSDAAAPVRNAAAWALGTIGAASSVDALSAAMTFENAELRETAAWALGTIEPERAPERLTAGLRDAAPEVRTASAWALGRIEDAETAPALQQALSDSNADVRSAVIWALGRVPGAAATEALTAALRDPNPDIRAAAAAALGGHGPYPWPWPRPWPRPRPQP